MLLIISAHYVNNSGLLDSCGPISSNPLCLKSLFLLLLGAFGKTGINCFVLITGYFMCKSKITVKKYLKLLFQIYFYKIIINAVFIFTGYIQFSLKWFVKTILPFTSLKTGFTGCFLVFYLTIPFLTILVNNMTETVHRRLLYLIFGFYVLFASVPWFDIGYSYVSWFICLFFIASYIRLYPNPLFMNTKLWGLMSILMLVVSCSSVIVFQYTSARLNLGSPYMLLNDSYKLLSVLTSVSWFLYFKNMNIKYSKMINSLGGATFGVLLIHANSDTMRQWLWKDLLNNVGMFDKGNMIYLHSVLSVLGIFAICAVIDILRKKFIEKPLFSYLEDKFSI